MLANTNKRASIFINHEQLETMLRLPEGMSILAMHASFDPAGIHIIVTSYDLEPAPLDSEAPRLAGGWNRRREAYFTGDGKNVVRSAITWEWEGNV